MGSCLSASAATNSGHEIPTAKVISIDGSLLEFSAPVEVSEVLGQDGLSFCFICDSDNLCYDGYILAMTHEELLVPGQLYFILPIEMTKHILSGSEMAALAVKASTALANYSDKKKRSRGNMRVMPFAGEIAQDGSVELSFRVKSSTNLRTGKGVSLKTEMGRRRFEVKLSAIREGDE